MNDLERYLAALQDADSEDAFLIAHVQGSEDFIQFKSYSDVYEIDFPIFTERQHSLEPRIISAGAALRLEPRVTDAGGGDRFIDFDANGTPGEVAGVVRALFTAVFDLSVDALLEFECAEFEAPAS